MKFFVYSLFYLLSLLSSYKIGIIMKQEIINWDKNVVGNIDLLDSIFNLPLRVDILNLVVKWQRAKKQSGNHKTRLIGEISGTTKKPWKQKGTGRARVGSLRVPHFRGGATMFGPRVRSHAYSLPKKIRRLGLKIALSCKKMEEKLIVIDNLEVDSFKTKDLVLKLNSFVKGKILFVIDSKEKNFTFASSNLPRLNTILYQGINVYDILNHDIIVLTKNALKNIEGRLG